MGRRARRRQREVQEVVRQLEQPAEGELPELVRLVRQRARLDEAIRAEVLRLRRAGASWTIVGAALGVSRQGARQRFGSAEEAR